MRRALIDFFWFIVCTVIGSWLLRKVPAKLTENAVSGWIDDKIGEYLYLGTWSETSTVVAFLWEWGLPAIVVAVALYSYHLIQKHWGYAVHSSDGKTGLTEAQPRPRSQTYKTPVFRGFKFEEGKFNEPPLTAEETAALDPFAGALFVSKIWFQKPDLESKGLIHINVDVFNGTPDPIYLKSVEGHISAELKKGPTKLPVPYFYQPTRNDFNAFGPFAFILAQKVLPQLRDLLVNWPDNETFIFDFQKLNIVVQSTKDAKKSARLPLWDQAQLRKRGDGIEAYPVFLIRPDKRLGIPARQ